MPNKFPNPEFFWCVLAAIRTRKTQGFGNFSRGDKHCVNPCSTNVSFLCSLKTSENFRLSDVFREYRSGTLVENGLMK